MKDRFPLRKLMPVIDSDLLSRYPGISPDGDVIRKGTARPVEEVQEGERAVIRYISTRDVDRDREILLPDGAELAEYLRNPIVLFGHNYSAPPHAKTVALVADDYGIKAKTVYADTAWAEELWQLVKGGFLNAASVGFMPVESVENGGAGWTEVTKRLARKWEVDAAEHFTSVKSIYTKWLLLEYSDVPVPSNASALIARAKAMGISPRLLKDLGLEEQGEPWNSEKPYPNESACRLRDPGDFDAGSFRRTERDHEGKKYGVIMGKLTGESTMTEQAYRYPKDSWEEPAARAHCKSHDGMSFEPAKARVMAIARPLVLPCVQAITRARAIAEPIDIDAEVRERIAVLQGKP